MKKSLKSLAEHYASKWFGAGPLAPAAQPGGAAATASGAGSGQLVLHSVAEEQGAGGLSWGPAYKKSVKVRTPIYFYAACHVTEIFTSCHYRHVMKAGIGAK